MANGPNNFRMLLVIIIYLKFHIIKANHHHHHHRVACLMDVAVSTSDLHHPCLSILYSMIGRCQTNVEWSDIRFNCAEEPSLTKSA